MYDELQAPAELLAALGRMGSKLRPAFQDPGHVLVGKQLGFRLLKCDQKLFGSQWQMS